MVGVGNGLLISLTFFTFVSSGAKLVQKTAYEVFDILGKEPLIEVAVGLEQAALSDDYFKQRKLWVSERVPFSNKT